MSTERERKKAKRADKQRKARALAAERREKRIGRERAAQPQSTTRGPRRDASGGASWPVKEAWISENAEERAVTVYAGVSRQHEDGRLAAMFFRVNLLNGMIDEVTELGDVEQGHVNFEVTQRAATAPMVFCEGDDVARLVHLAAAWREDEGEGPAPELARVRSFLHDLDPDEGQVEPIFGDPADDDDTELIQLEPPAVGFWGSVKRIFGLS